MQLYCPPCRAAFAGTSHCPKCGVRLLAPQESFVLSGTPKTPPPPPITPTLFGRVVVGAMAGLLVYGGVRDLLTAAGVPVVSAVSLSAAGLTGLAVLALAAIAGGVLAGAGRLDGVTVGGIAGLLVGGLPVGVMVASGEPLPVENWLMIAVAVGLAVIGAAGGALGGRTWPSAILRPADIDGSSHGSSLARLAEEEQEKRVKRPTNWGRVIVATLLVVAAVMMSDFFRAALHKGSLGMVKVMGQRESTTVGFQIAVMLLPVAGMLAGAGTGSGVRHGLYTGLIAAAAVFAATVRTPDNVAPAIEGAFVTFGEAVQPMTTLLGGGRILGGIVVLTTFGGWLGGALFMPLAPKSMRRKHRFGND